MLDDAIRFYHDRLDEELAQASQAQLDEQQQRYGLFFGNRPLCTVLRPRFLTPEHFRYLQQRVARLLAAFARIHRLALADPDFRRQFGLLEWEEELVGLDPGYRSPTPLARLDTFFDPATLTLKVTEYNAETPAAAAYNDVLSEVFLGLPVMGEFMKRYQVRPLPARADTLHALLDSYRQWRGRRERPRVAILDWSEVPTYSEFVLFADYFRSHGLECIIADPRAAEYRNGRLYIGDFAVDLIYKRVLTSELVRWGGLDQPILRAVRDRAVCMVNPPACKLLYKKASLAVLSDERHRHLFSAEENAAIRAHVPWTRLVTERYTEYNGEQVDLIPFVLAHRAQLVLKPNDEYGGKGIVLGWEVDDSAWAAAVQTALTEPYIVQERITIPTEPYPGLVDGRLQLIPRLFDTAPFCFDGEFMSSCLTRLSTVALLNVTAGGGSTVPTFVVEERS